MTPHIEAKLSEAGWLKSPLDHTRNGASQSGLDAGARGEPPATYRKFEGDF